MSEMAMANAGYWAADITAIMEAFTALEKDESQPVTYDGEEFTDSDTLRERILEMPLSVLIRDGWRQAGGSAEPEEFEILLSTGGPAVRIYGDIGGEQFLQYQCWGTPWTNYRHTTEQNDEALRSFVNMFYFED